jgi:membrane protein
MLFNIATGRELMLLKHVEQILTKISRDKVFTQAGALSYYTALAVAPMVLLLISFLSWLRFDLQSQFLQQTRNLMGPEASRVFESIINSANKRPDLSVTAGWVGAVALALSASAVFVQLQTALNTIFEAPVENKTGESKWSVVKNFFASRLLSIGVLLALMFISIVSLVVSTSLSFVTSQYEFQLFGFQVLSGAADFAVYTLLFSLLYRWMPDRSVRRKNTFKEGALTALMFIIGKAGIGTYLGQTAVGSAYGAAGSLIVMLVWIYYSALVFFIGAEISSLYLVQSKST